MIYANILNIGSKYVDLNPRSCKVLRYCVYFYHISTFPVDEAVSKIMVEV